MLIHSSTPGPGQRPHQWALRASGWQNMSPQHMTVGFQDTPSLEMQLRHIDHFDLRALWKTTNAGQGFLWILLICLKTDPLKHPKCHKSPPWESHQLHQVRLLSQGRRLSQHYTTQSRSPTIIPLIHSSKEGPIHLSEKSISLPYDHVHPPSSFLIKMVFNPEF